MLALKEIQDGLILSHKKLDETNSKSATDFIYYFNLLLEELKSSAMDTEEQKKAAQKKAFMVYAAIAFYWSKINAASFNITYGESQLALDQFLEMEPDKHLVDAILKSGQLQKFSDYAHSGDFLIGRNGDDEEKKQILFALMDSLLVRDSKELTGKFGFYKKFNDALSSTSEFKRYRTAFYVSLAFFWLAGIPPLVAYYFYREAGKKLGENFDRAQQRVVQENNKVINKNDLSFDSKSSLNALAKDFPNRPRDLNTVFFTENLDFAKALKIKSELLNLASADEAYINKISTIKFKYNGQDYQVARDGASSADFLTRFCLYVAFLDGDNLLEKSKDLNISQLRSSSPITAANFTSVFSLESGNGPFKLKSINENYYFSLLYQWVSESKGQVRLDCSALSNADCQKAESALLTMIKALNQRNESKQDNEKPEILKLSDIVIDSMPEQDLKLLVKLINDGTLDVKSVHCKGVTFKREGSFNFCLDFARAWAKDNTNKQSFVEVTFNKAKDKAIGFSGKKSASFKVAQDFNGYVFCEDTKEVYYCSQQKKIKIAKIAQNPQANGQGIGDTSNLTAEQLKALRSEINKIRELSAENLATGYFADHQPISCATDFVITKACASYKFNIAAGLLSLRNSRPAIYYRTEDGFDVKLTANPVNAVSLEQRIRDYMRYDQMMNGEAVDQQKQVTNFESLLRSQRQDRNYCRFSLKKVETLDSFQPDANQSGGISHVLAYQISSDKPAQYKIFSVNQGNSEQIALKNPPRDLDFLIHIYDDAGHNDKDKFRKDLIEKLEQATALNAVDSAIKLKYQFFTSFNQADEAAKCLLNYIKLNPWANVDYSDLLETEQGIRQLLQLLGNKDFQNRLVFNKKVAGEDGGEELVPTLFTRHDSESAKDFVARVIVDTAICPIDSNQLGAVLGEHDQQAKPVNSLYHLLHNDCEQQVTFSAELLPIKLSDLAVAAIKEKAAAIQEITIESLESVLKTGRFFELFSDALASITIAGSQFVRKQNEKLDYFLFRVCLSAPVSNACRKQVLDYYLTQPARIQLDEVQLDELAFKDESQFADFIEKCVGDEAVFKAQSQLFAKFNEIVVRAKRISLAGTASTIFTDFLLSFAEIDKKVSDAKEYGDQASSAKKLPGQKLAAMVGFLGKPLSFDSEVFKLGEQNCELVKDPRFCALVQRIELDEQFALEINLADLQQLRSLKSVSFGEVGYSRSQNERIANFVARVTSEIVMSQARAVVKADADAETKINKLALASLQCIYLDSGNIERRSKESDNNFLLRAVFCSDDNCTQEDLVKVFGKLFSEKKSVKNDGRVFNVNVDNVFLLIAGAYQFEQQKTQLSVDFSEFDEATVNLFNDWVAQNNDVVEIKKHLVAPHQKASEILGEQHRQNSVLNINLGHSTLSDLSDEHHQLIDRINSVSVRAAILSLFASHPECKEKVIALLEKPGLLDRLATLFERCNNNHVSLSILVEMLDEVDRVDRVDRVDEVDEVDGVDVFSELREVSPISHLTLYDGVNLNSVIALFRNANDDLLATLLDVIHSAPQKSVYVLSKIRSVQSLNQLLNVFRKAGSDCFESILHIVDCAQEAELARFANFFDGDHELGQNSAQIIAFIDPSENLDSVLDSLEKFRDLGLESVGQLLATLPDFGSSDKETFKKILMLSNFPTNTEEDKKLFSSLMSLLLSLRSYLTSQQLTKLLDSVIGLGCLAPNQLADWEYLSPLLSLFQLLESSKQNFSILASVVNKFSQAKEECPLSHERRRFLFSSLVNFIEKAGNNQSKADLSKRLVNILHSCDVGYFREVLQFLYNSRDDFSELTYFLGFAANQQQVEGFVNLFKASTQQQILQLMNLFKGVSAPLRADILPRLWMLFSANKNHLPGLLALFEKEKVRIPELLEVFELSRSDDEMRSLLALFSPKASFFSFTSDSDQQFIFTEKFRQFSLINGLGANAGGKFVAYLQNRSEAFYEKSGQTDILLRVLKSLVNIKYNADDLAKVFSFLIDAENSDEISEFIGEIKNNNNFSRIMSLLASSGSQQGLVTMHKLFVRITASQDDSRFEPLLNLFEFMRSANMLQVMFDLFATNGDESHLDRLLSLTCFVSNHHNIVLKAAIIDLLNGARQAHVLPQLVSVLEAARTGNVLPQLVGVLEAARTGNVLPQLVGVLEAARTGNVLSQLVGVLGAAQTAGDGVLPQLVAVLREAFNEHLLHEILSLFDRAKSESRELINLINTLSENNAGSKNDFKLFATPLNLKSDIRNKLRAYVTNKQIGNNNAPSNFTAGVLKIAFFDGATDSSGQEPVAVQQRRRASIS